MSGSNGHKPDCGCPLCRGKVRTAEREREEAEQAATVRATARLGVWMAAQLARSGATGPDVLRQALGRDDAQRVLQMAGMDVGVFPASWAGQPARQMNTNVFASGYADPDHDPRVTKVMQRSGATWDEINQIRRQVTEEYDLRQLERQARDDIYHGRGQQERQVPLPGPGACAVTDARGVPVQVSTVLHEWEDYPDHAPETA